MMSDGVGMLVTCSHGTGEEDSTTWRAPREGPAAEEPRSVISRVKERPKAAQKLTAPTQVQRRAATCGPVRHPRHCACDEDDDVPTTPTARAFL